MSDPVWRTEWAVEVTWRDPEKAGASGPTSQFGPMSTPEHRDRFLDAQRRDRDVVAVRVLERRAAYTAWCGGDAVPISVEERDRALQAFYDEMMP